MPRHDDPPCRACQIGQRLSTLAFAIFAVALMLARLDPALSDWQRHGLTICAALCALAVIRNPLAWLAERLFSPRRRSGRRSGRRLGRSQ
ncbi:hypothetical protein [Paracoccus sp. NSM]|uniref:hypothetical protein n=1 Tax=Paracoccus sp. NSM TaxID=3457784 RepID=UPI0040350A44